MKEIKERKKILKENKLCFICTGKEYQASECKSKRSCQICQRKYHTWICDKNSQMMMVTESLLIHPVVVVKANNVIGPALLDAGVRSSYTLAASVDWLKLKPIKKKKNKHRYDDVLNNKEIGNLWIRDIRIVREIQNKFNNLQSGKNTLLSLPNPKYKAIIGQYKNLAGINMNDCNTKPELPIHMILGASNYARIKVPKMPRVGSPGKLVAELTYFGWVIMPPGDEIGLNNLMLSRTSRDDYEGLCYLDLLGIQDIPKTHEHMVHTNFKEQLKQIEEGWYETGLMWKQVWENLQNNEAGSLRRLQNLIVKK